MDGRLTRAQFLGAAAGAGGVLAASHPALGALRGLGSEVRAARAGRGLSFRSRPDLHPPGVWLAGAPLTTSDFADGYAFLGPASRTGTAQPGALVVDATGAPVWFRPIRKGHLVSNLKVQRYRGEPVLTWWEGKVLPGGYGQGEGVIVDRSYREIARVRGARGRHIDHHEFKLTPRGSALVTCYPETVITDLSAVGGPRVGQVGQSIIQEIDVRSRRLLFEWRSIEHIPVAESYLPTSEIYDYLHANSIDLTPDGDLLVGARHTWTVYKLGRRTGRVIWRLGGKHSDFRMARHARFAWQHDARHLPGGVITLFDDGGGPFRAHSQSRGLALELDFPRRTARVLREYRHSPPWLSYAMGSMETLADGRVVVGWGNIPLLSKFNPDGTLIRDMWFPWGHASYRGFYGPWSAQPRTLPALATTFDQSSANSTLYVSWNGATGVAAWRVSIGSSTASLAPVGVARRTGFETAIALGSAGGFAAVTALDAGGRSLASSHPVKLGS